MADKDKRCKNVQQEKNSGKTLKQKVRILFSFSISLYILLFLSFYIFVFRGNINRQIEKMGYDTMVSIENDMHTSFANISAMGKIIMNNNEIRDYLRREDELSNTFHVVSSIHSVTTAFNDIDSVYVFRLDGAYIDISNGVSEVNEELITDQEWNEKIFSRAGGNVILLNGDGLFRSDEGKNILSFVRVINDINTQMPIGVLAINSSMSLLENTYKAMMDEKTSFAVYEEGGELLCGDAKERSEEEWKAADVFETKKSGIDSFEYWYRIGDTPLILLESVKINYVKQLPLQSVALVMLVVAITVLCFMLISHFIKKEVTEPIGHILTSMEYVKSGWLRRVSNKLPNDEMRRLKNSYNEMLIEINRLIEELLEKEKDLRKVEIEAMQEQIKPHFLYNTLDMIASLALEHDAEEVYEALEALGVFYRNFLSRGAQEITIGDELEITKSYLKLQKLRYGAILDEKFIVEKGVENKKILKLILQPLVENSLYHGAIPKGETCIVCIRVQAVEGDLVISVTDSGVGVSEEELDQILATDSKSFGLKKTIERIQNFYGEKSSYRIKSRQGYFFQVVIRIPMAQDFCSDRINSQQGGKGIVQGNDCG